MATGSSSRPNPSTGGYEPLPSEAPPAYTPAAGLPPGYSTKPAGFEDAPPQPGTYYPAGSYQGGAPPRSYPSASSGYQQQSVAHVVSPPAPSVIVIGGCPFCEVGVLEDLEDYCSSMAIFFTIILFVLLFPLGVLCCVMLREKRCSNCGAIFGCCHN